MVDGVAHVAPADPRAEGRLFGYRISRTVADVRQSAKSRYYPIELSAVLDEIRATPGRYAVVGVPCFIKAVQLARTIEPLLAERIAFTIGLFCGHMKSARMVDSFALQMGADPAAVRAVDFRLKDERRPANWYRTQLVLADRSTAEQDWWHLVEGDWGSGFFQNSACNFCDDVVAETADIALGDAWVEPYSSDGRGTNVVVVRSAGLHAMVEQAVAAGRLALSPVDTEFVVATQAAGGTRRLASVHPFPRCRRQPPSAPPSNLSHARGHLRLEPPPVLGHTTDRSAGPLFPPRPGTSRHLSGAELRPRAEWRLLRSAGPHTRLGKRLSQPRPHRCDGLADEAKGVW
jgi:coenzyme F420-reducing hydrogenase beta subunit